MQTPVNQLCRVTLINTVGIEMRWELTLGIRSDQPPPHGLYLVQQLLNRVVSRGTDETVEELGGFEGGLAGGD